MVWFFNLYLYLTYLQNPPLYQQLVAGGMTCWVQASTANLPTDGQGISGNLQPACWYDPSNSNNGHQKTASRPIVRRGR